MKTGRRSWPRRVITGAGLLCLLALILLAVVFNTSAGARWAIARVAAVVPGDVESGDLQGTLWRGIRVSTLAYRDGTLEVRAESLALRIDWVPLLAGRLVVPLLEAGTVTVEGLDSGKGASGTPGLRFDPLLIGVEIGRARVGRLPWPGGAAREITNLELGMASLQRGSRRLNVGTLSLGLAGAEIEAGGLVARLDADVPLSMRLRWTFGDWAGSGTVEGSLSRLALEQSVTGPLRFELGGMVDPYADGAPSFDLQADWDDWQVGDVPLRNGHLQLKGQIEDYAAEYAFDAWLPGDRQARITGSAQGHPEGLGSVRAALASRFAEAGFDGAVSWQDGLSVAGSVEVSEFDPTTLWPGRPGRLEARADMILERGGDVEFNNIRASGMLDGISFDASGGLRLSGKRWHCAACVVRSGDNRVRADGWLGESELDVKLDAVATRLSEAWQGLSGSLRAGGRLHGKLPAPVFTGHAEADTLGWAGWSAQSVVAIGEGAGEFGLSVTVSGLSRESTPLGDFTARARGDIGHIRAEADWISGDLSAEAEADFEIGDRELTGMILGASFSEPATGVWRLGKPVRFFAAPGMVEVGPHAWSGASGAVRIDALILGGRGTVLKAGVDRVPLGLLDHWLPPGYGIRGQAEAAVDISRGDDGWDGTIEWRQSGTALDVEQPDGTIVEVSIPRAEASARLAGGGATLKAWLAIDPGVTGELGMTLDGLHRDAGVDGTLQLQGSDWDWIPAILPETDRVTGQVSANLRAAGKLSAPVISGRMSWQSGRLVVPALNVPLDDIELSVSGGPAGTLAVTGSARAGEGALRIDGEMNNITNPERSAKFRIHGESAELLNWDEYRLWASPEIVIESAKPGWAVSGRLEVPRADINLRQLPEGAVTPSDDIRVAGAEETPARPTSYSGEVELVLGEQVRVRLHGLDTRLRGNLAVRMPRGRAPSAIGQVSLEGGTFVAYGQKLAIQEGTLTFTGPLDNPVVDVRAVRVVETFEGPVTAGIHLQGRALNLSSTVFSTPAMSEADALSYLLVGRPLSQASNAEGSQMAAAALALGLSQAGRVTEQIGRRLGLDQLSLADVGSDSTALVAGKQVNQRLYARYAYGVFSRIGTLLLRYRLSRHLALEATSGERESIDVLYTIEKR